MKITLLISFLLIASECYSQKDSLISYSEIVMTDSIKQNQLFLNARDWFNKSFNSSKDVLQIIDKETGQLAGKGILGGYYSITYFATYTYPIDCSFSIDIKVRDGKYKYSFTNFEPKGDSQNANIYFPTLTSSNVCPTKIPMMSQDRTNRYWITYKDAVNEEMKKVISDLKVSMIKKSDDGF